MLTPKQKKIVSDVILELPEDSSDVPSEFLALDPSEVAEEIESHIVYRIADLDQIKLENKIIKKLLIDLDRFKDRLGGAPNFLNGTPTLYDQDAHRTFLGQPMSAVKDWIRMTLKKQWFPKFFWNFIAKLFKVSLHSTPYENIHLSIQRLGKVSANKEKIFDILDSNDPSRYIEFNTTTGLSWHPRINTPGVEKFYIRMIDDYLTIYYEDAKARGDDALIQFFHANQGLCFEDKAKNIEQYMTKHPTLTMQQKTSPDEIPADAIANYNSETPVNEVIYRECAELRIRKKEVTGTPQELWDHLVKKGVIGKTFPSVDGSTNVQITLEYLNSDEVRTDLIDIVMVLEDGPKIEKKSDDIDNASPSL